MSIEFRFLEPEEVAKIEPVFASLGCEAPKDGRIWAGIESGEVISFQCLHRVWHAGPVWVKPENRGNGLWKRMQEALESILPSGFGFYQFGTDKNQSQLARMGLTPLGWMVWAKRVK